MSKYDNFVSNLNILAKAAEQDLSNEFVLSGIVDKFAMQFELSWKLLQKTLGYEGLAAAATGSPRGILKEAYSAYDFIDEDIWLDMLEDRNKANHVYDSEMAARLVSDILATYIGEFDKLRSRLEELYGTELLSGL